MKLIFDTSVFLTLIIYKGFNKISPLCEDNTDISFIYSSKMDLS